MRSQSQPHSLANAITSGITQPRFCKCENFLLPFFLSISEAKMKFNSFCHMKDLIVANVNNSINYMFSANHIYHVEGQKKATYKPI